MRAFSPQQGVTRARRHCCLVCDTDTVSNEKFMKRLVDHFSTVGDVRSAEEYT